MCLKQDFKKLTRECLDDGTELSDKKQHFVQQQKQRYILLKPFLVEICNATNPKLVKFSCFETSGQLQMLNNCGEIEVTWKITPNFKLDFIDGEISHSFAEGFQVAETCACSRPCCKDDFFEYRNFANDKELTTFFICRLAKCLPEILRVAI